MYFFVAENIPAIIINQSGRDGSGQEAFKGSLTFNSPWYLLEMTARGEDGILLGEISFPKLKGLELLL